MRSEILGSARLTIRTLGKRITTLLLGAFLSLTFAGIVSAADTIVDFQLDSVTTSGAPLPSSTTYSPSLPVVGWGALDLVAGTGDVHLQNYAITIDVSMDMVDDARIDISGWNHTISSVDGSGNVVSTGGGSASCTVLGGFGSFICPGISTTIPGWPPADAPPLLSSAILDEVARTITVTDNSNSQAGTITTIYSWTVPEPGTGLLLGGGLVGLCLSLGRGRRNS
jgi:hypothetical protein